MIHIISKATKLCSYTGKENPSEAPSSTRMPFSSLSGISAHPCSSSTASNTGVGMSDKELFSLDLEDFVDSPPSDDPLDFLRCECFGAGFSELDEPPWFELRWRRELRLLPSAADSPEGQDERCRLEPFSECRRAEEESKDVSDDVCDFDFRDRFAFCTSISPDSIQT